MLILGLLKNSKDELLLYEGNPSAFRRRFFHFWIVIFSTKFNSTKSTEMLQRSLVPSFLFLSIYLLSLLFVLGLFMYNFMWFIKLRAWAGMCWVCMGVQCTWVCARVRGCLHGCAWGFRPFRFGSPKLEWQSNLIVFNIGKSYVGAQNSD